MRIRDGKTKSIARGAEEAREDGLHSFSGGSSHVSGYSADAINKSRSESSSSKLDDGRDLISTTSRDDGGLIKNSVNPWDEPLLIKMENAVNPWTETDLQTTPDYPKELETLSRHSGHIVNTFKEADMVNHPPHYASDGIECIEAIQAQLTKEEYRGYLKGNVAKYLWREKHKGGTESLKKAQWYLARLVELN
jgi:hypothetical protein